LKKREILTTTKTMKRGWRHAAAAETKRGRGTRLQVCVLYPEFAARASSVRKLLLKTKKQLLSLKGKFYDRPLPRVLGEMTHTFLTH
jgi:hypothetical protein